MDGMATLVLSNVQVDDSGQFVCRATNQEGQDETKCHVTVEGIYFSCFVQGSFPVVKYLSCLIRVGS